MIDSRLEELSNFTSGGSLEISSEWTQHSIGDGQAYKPVSALLPRSAGDWLRVFGPGAIIASLTIGTGELIFSTRGGVLFGYRILFLFAAILFCKWLLLYTTARHMVLGGVHPMQRWMELPGGPRGWFPSLLFIFAVLCIPVWTAFHAAVLGDLIAGLTGTKSYLAGAMVHVWGILILFAVSCVALRGGYATLERVQLAIVSLMLAAMLVALCLMQPDWKLLAMGLIVPQPLAYPDWLMQDPSPVMQKIAATPVWVEATLYVGVIGGAGFDYLAYTSYLREKCWGMAQPVRDCPPSQLGESRFTTVELRAWLRVLIVDSSLSFIAVLIFSGVFVASGHLILEPLRQLPGDGNFLQFQAQFITRVHPWLHPLYVIGVSLTMLGTLYGTLEVAPTVMREWLWGTERSNNVEDSDRIRRYTLVWCGAGGCLVLSICLIYQVVYGQERPPGLTMMLVPANLFTGVLSCGLILISSPWMDQFLPKPLRNHFMVNASCLIVGVAFLALGLKGYWDFGGWPAFGILAITLAVGWASAPMLDRLLRVQR